MDCIYFVTGLNDLVSKTLWRKIFFLSSPRHCNRGLIVVIVYYSETAKNTALLLVEHISSHMDPMYIETPYISSHIAPTDIETPYICSYMAPMYIETPNISSHIAPMYIETPYISIHMTPMYIETLYILSEFI